MKKLLRKTKGSKYTTSLFCKTAKDGPKKDGTVQRKTIKVGLVPMLAVDVLLGGDFGDIFAENRKLENTFNEYETLTSTGQNEALIVPEDKETKFIVRVFPRKVREILVEYEKPNVRVQFPFDDEIFVSAVRIKKTKREKKDIKRNYNKERQ